MKNQRKLLLTTILGGGLGLAAATLVPAPAQGSGCILGLSVSGRSCESCEREDDGFECNHNDENHCWADSGSEGCTNWW